MVITRQYAESLIPLIIAPLYTLIFVTLLRHGGRADLSGYALIGPAFIALWWYVLYQGGAAVQVDRWSETIGPHVTTPTPYPGVVFGEIEKAAMVVESGHVIGQTQTAQCFFSGLALNDSVFELANALL